MTTIIDAAQREQLLGRREKLRRGCPLASCDEHFQTVGVWLEPGDAWLLYTDGVTETEDGTGEMYGVERLARAAGASAVSAPGDLVRTCVDDVTAFRGAGVRADDLTVMAIRRAP